MPAARLRPALAALAAAPALIACAATGEAMIGRGFEPAHAAGCDAGGASGKEAAGGLIAEAAKDQSRCGADDQ